MKGRPHGRCEMRIYKIRFDVLLCIVLSSLVVLGISKILPVFYSMLYQRYTQTHMVSDGDIGGKAGDDVYRVENVEELFSHNTFTVQVEYGSLLTADTDYFGDIYLMNLELPSGERVAACINSDAVQQNYEEDYFIMPVGKVVEADLSKDVEFINGIERSDALSRTDFYLDMNGNSGSGLVSVEGYDEQYTIYIKAIAAVLCFMAFHIAGCKAGIFPSLSPGKKKRERA